MRRADPASRPPAAHRKPARSGPRHVPLGRYTPGRSRPRGARATARSGGARPGRRDFTGPRGTARSGGTPGPSRLHGTTRHSPFRLKGLLKIFVVEPGEPGREPVHRGIEVGVEID